MSQQLTGLNGLWVCGHVLWQRHAKQKRQAHDEHVPGGVHVHKLQISDSHSRDHAKHHHEYPSHYGVRDGGEQRADFTQNSDNQHEHGAELHDSAASDL